MLGSLQMGLMSKPSAHAFVPTDLGAGLLLWLKSDTVNSSGGNLTTWPDQSGNGKTATSSGTNMVVNATGINGHPTLTVALGGTTCQNISTYAWTPGNDVTLYMVCKPSDATGGWIFGNATPFGNNKQFLMGNIGSNLVIRDSGFGPDQVAASEPSVNGVVMVWEVGVIYGSAGTLKINGTSYTLTGGTNGTENGAAAYNVGTNGLLFNGELGDIIVIAGTNSTDCTNVRNYLTTAFA